MSSHHHKEQRQVAAAARPVAVQVDSQAHLIAVFTCVEGCEIMDTKMSRGCQASAFFRPFAS